MKYLIALALCLGGGMAWGEGINLVSTGPFSVYTGMTVPVIYQITRDSETWTLEHFIESGRFCEFRGKHEWEPYNPCEGVHGPNGTWANFVSGCDSLSLLPNPSYKCELCGKQRKRVVVKKEEETWEP